MSKTVLIVDDSAFIRILLTKALTSTNEIEVVGAAEDPIVAAEMIKQTKPTLSFWQIWNMSFGFLGIQFAHSASSLGALSFLESNNAFF